MSNLRYITIDSNYRDRNRWPLPAEFEVDFTMNSNKDRFKADDPICYSAPDIVFNTVFDQAGYTQTITGTVVTTTLGATTTSQKVVMSFPADTLSIVRNYYQGAVGNRSSAPADYKARIFEYEFVTNNNGSGNAIGIFTFLDAFGVPLVSGNTIVITNPTDFTLKRVFVPGGIFMSNAYIDHYIVNETQTSATNVVYATIVEYDIVTKLVTVSEDISTWANTDRFSLRNELPIMIQVINVTPSTDTFRIPAQYQSFPLVGSYIRFPNTAYTDTSNISRRISSSTLDTSTNEIVIKVSPPFPGVHQSPNLFEFMKFSRDNNIPLNYSGNLITQQEVSCYEIQLIDLILPNNVLAVAGGGLTSTYPYVYVGLQNASTSSNYSDVLYSNNPYAKNMLFKIAIPNVNDPITTPFIRVINPNVVQTVKFKPNDTLKFIVKVPTGQVFKTITNDTTTPQLPLDSIQISAQFSLRKI